MQHWMWRAISKMVLKPSFFRFSHFSFVQIWFLAFGFWLRYHVPRSWFKSSGNELVIFEEKGGYPTKIKLSRRKVTEVWTRSYRTMHEPELQLDSDVTMKAKEKIVFLSLFLCCSSKITNKISITLWSYNLSIVHMKFTTFYSFYLFNHHTAFSGMNFLLHVLKPFVIVKLNNRVLLCPYRWFQRLPHFRSLLIDPTHHEVHFPISL